LHTLLGQFMALRHDVNLQTRATRAQQQQNGVALEQLAQALDSLRRAEAATREAQQASAEETLRPLLKTLVDLYDALALAAREVQRAQDGLVPLLEQMAPSADGIPDNGWPEPPPASVPSRSWWRRLFRSGTKETTALTEEVARLRSELREERRLRAEEANRARAAAERVRQAVGSLVTGYGMGLQRVERALRQHGLETIVAAGEPFDPERMEVVDVVAANGVPSGAVLEEVRRGYLWNGRVFRYAQVRVAKR
jgi:molecular chaperone GrpE